MNIQKYYHKTNWIFLWNIGETLKLYIFMPPIWYHHQYRNHTTDNSLRFNGYHHCHNFLKQCLCRSSIHSIYTQICVQCMQKLCVCAYVCIFWIADKKYSEITNCTNSYHGLPLKWQINLYSANQVTKYIVQHTISFWIYGIFFLHKMSYCKVFSCKSKARDAERSFFT